MPSGLPRPGYEPKRLRFGQTVISPELLLSMGYDSNVRADSADVEDDVLFQVTPRVGIETRAGKLQLDSDLYATYNAYAKRSEEDASAFGGSLGGSYEINRAHSVRGRVSYVRATESREDPDADRAADKPTEVDRFSTELAYRYRRNRLAFTPRVAVERTDFLETDENDRDRWNFLAALRSSLVLGAGLETFIEPYYRRNEADVTTDRRGFDRDFDVAGLFLGGNFGGGKWVGELAAGVFHANFDDSAFDDVVGLGARGSFLWSISERTGLRADLGRDIVPTDDVDSSSRIDTRVALQLEQEIRHNIVGAIGGEIRTVEYEGGDRDILTASLAASGEYFLNGQVSFVLSLRYSERFGDRDIDEFDRFIAIVSTRLRF